MWSALFPGQGSQFVGMVKPLFDEFKKVQILFEEASDTLAFNFKKLCFEGPDADLDLTENTQPALLLASYATFSILEDTCGFKPEMGAGHSLGEYSALVSAKSLSFTDAIKTVRTRGQLMQQAVPVGVGAMLAVLGLEDNEVIKICEWAKTENSWGVIEPANYNSPGQVVLSGSKKMIDWVQANFQAEAVFHEPKRVKFIPLKVSAPFHCSLMKPAQDQMAFVLNALAFESPAFSIIQNVSAQETLNPETLRHRLCEQISAPVKWNQSIKRMSELGVTHAIECGPGKVLSGLTKKITQEGKPITTFNIQTVEDIKNLEKVFKP